MSVSGESAGNVTFCGSLMAAVFISNILRPRWWGMAILGQSLQSAITAAGGTEVLASFATQKGKVEMLNLED